MPPSGKPLAALATFEAIYITTGDEFSYIASIKSATDAQGQITTTSDIQRMNSQH
jgi:hypothetical protein